MSWPPKGSFGSPLPSRAASAPDAGRVAQRGTPSQQGVLAAGVILLREPEEGEMEVLIGRYEVINAFRSERHRTCVPMRFAGEYHFPGGAKRQTDLGPLQTACRELHEEFGVGVHLGTRGVGMQAEAMGPPELAATLFCKAHVALCSSGDKEREPASAPLHARRAERSSAPSTLQARRASSAPSAGSPAAQAASPYAAADDSMAGGVSMGGLGGPGEPAPDLALTLGLTLGLTLALTQP